MRLSLFVDHETSQKSEEIYGASAQGDTYRQYFAFDFIEFRLCLDPRLRIPGVKKHED